MKPNKVRTAIIGCGKVGHLHAAALKTLPASELVAVCESNVERGKAFGEKYGVKAYASVDELVAAKVAEMVTVATPHPIHAEAAIKALRGGSARAGGKTAGVVVGGLRCHAGGVTRRRRHAGHDLPAAFL